MRTIGLKPRALTAALLNTLEQNGLVYQLRETQSIRENTAADAAEPIYTGNAEHGAHMLVCVRKAETVIRLTTHTDNEDIIFITRNKRMFKPLYLIMATVPAHVLNEKVKTNTLTDNDILALEVAYNDPATAMFTIRREAAHCEVTVAGDGEAPVFFVAEPSAMQMHYLDLADTRLELRR